MQMELAGGALTSPQSPDPLNAKPAWKFYFPGGFTDSRESDECANRLVRVGRPQRVIPTFNSRTNLPALFTALSI
jgi:hypothetical protein